MILKGAATKSVKRFSVFRFGGEKAINKLFIQSCRRGIFKKRSARKEENMLAEIIKYFSTLLKKI